LHRRHLSTCLLSISSHTIPSGFLPALSRYGGTPLKSPTLYRESRGTALFSDLRNPGHPDEIRDPYPPRARSFSRRPRNWLAETSRFATAGPGSGWGGHNTYVRTTKNDLLPEN
jgi:hypothetical protein